MVEQERFLQLFNRIQELLKLLRDRYDKKKAPFLQREEQVKISLIVPLLQALGWDITDPDEVGAEVEVPSFSQRADIVLYWGESPAKTSAVIEVKKASENLYKAEWEQQAMQYAASIGAPYAVLTNGLKWRVFKSFKPNTSLSERLLFEMELSPDKWNALKFMLLSKELIPYLEDYAPLLRGLNSANSPLLGILLKLLLVEEEEKGAPLSGNDKKDISPAGITTGVSSRGKRKFKLTVGDLTFEANSYQRLTQQVIKWAAATGRLTRMHLPLKTPTGKHWIGYDETKMASRYRRETFPNLGTVFVSYGPAKEIAKERLEQLLKMLGLEYKIEVEE